MKVKDIYRDAIIYQANSLILLLDFLLDKRVISMDDPQEKIDYFFQDKFRNRLNPHLHEYNKKVKLVDPSKIVKETFEIVHKDTAYFVVAYTKEQAAAFFKNEIGQVERITLLPEQSIVIRDGVKVTFEELMKKSSKIPNIMGSYDFYD